MDRRTVLAAMGSGVSLMSLEAAGLRADAQKPGRWLQVESANFSVLSSLSEKDTREEVAALEAFHRLMNQLLPAPADIKRPKLNVHIASLPGDFTSAAPDIASRIAGLYQSGIEQTRAITAPGKMRSRQRDMKRNVRADDDRTILFHEYAHHCMHANIRMIYPAWYVEGFAEYFATVMFEREGAHLGKMAESNAFWLIEGRWMPIRTLLTAEPFALDSPARTQFYAQSWLATHMLVNRRERSEGFDRYARALMEGGDPLEAFEPSFGVTLDAFDAELKAYRDVGLVFRNAPGVLTDPATPMTITRLPPSVDRLMMPMSYLWSLPPAESAAEAIATVREHAARHPDDPIVGHAAAHVDVWYGDLAAARTRLDGLLAQPSAQTHHLSGLCDLRRGYVQEDQALFQKARAAFARAYNMDATRAGSLFRYAECDLAISGEMSAATTDVFVEAFRMAPQVSPAAIMAAQGLMANDRFGEAVVVLRPLASSVHAEGLRDLARTLLAEARAGKFETYYFVGWARPDEADAETTP